LIWSGGVGLERDRQIAVEGRPQAFQARVGRRPLAGPAAGLEGGGPPLQPAGIQKRLPAVGDHAHQRYRVLGRGDRPQ
jgi:hypothetical protein